MCCQDIDKEGGIIEGEGIKLFFPNDALPHGESSTIKIYATVDGPTEHCGLFSVSPIFHVKCEPHREFQKEVQVTIEHFTKLEVEDDIDNLVFMVSKNNEEEFYPAAGGVMTELGSRYGTVMVNHFSRFGFFKRRGTCIGFIKINGYRQRSFYAICRAKVFLLDASSITSESLYSRRIYLCVLQHYSGQFNIHQGI